MFDSTQFHSLTDLIEAHDHFLRQEVDRNILFYLQGTIPKAVTQFHQLRRSFLGIDPVNPEFHSLGNQFSLESTRKQLNAQVRRYAMGQQAKGLHVKMRAATTPIQHLKLAMEVPHPSVTVQSALEPSWQFVFTQLAESFQRFGVVNTTIRLNQYRDRVNRWLTQLCASVNAVQQLAVQMSPPGPRSVSGHVNYIFFYLLLLITNYPNPKFAFNFWHGASLVGDFFSPALTAREKLQGGLSDSHIELTRQKCLAALRTVKCSLSPAAAAKSMKKMQTEFASGTLIGPFDTFEQLRSALECEVRKIPGFEKFVVREEYILVSPQFSVEELHAYEEKPLPSYACKSPGSSPELAAEDSSHEFKVRNIWNAKILNFLTNSYSTYVPNTHADVSVIVLYWIQLTSKLGFQPTLHGYPADFKSAYRQMPVSPLQILFAAVAYFHYEEPTFAKGRRRYAFYTSLPFGSSLAPAHWSETCVALAHIMAYVVLSIITHCIDDVCSIEMEEMVTSSRESFLHLVSLLGLQLDMDKSLSPSADFIYLGLRLLLPTQLTRQVFAIKIPPARRDKLIWHLEAILNRNQLTSGEASSMRGRLYFYAAWFQEARSHLAELAARQYSKNSEAILTQELIIAFEFFLHTLKSDSRFLDGIQPWKIVNRAVAWLYTDGSLEGNKTLKGIGGICFPSLSPPAYWYGESISPTVPGYHHIAPIEMYAILRALVLFGPLLQGKAVWLFCDNAHSVGCLLRRSSMVREDSSVSRKRPFSTCDTPKTPEQHFLELSDDIKRGMNEMARAIWQKITELDLIVWIEYVWTKVNLADDPSRGDPPCVPGIRVGLNTSIKEI